MLILLPVALLAGAITGISPCVLPVLPIVLVDWAAPASLSARRRRATATALGLVLSFGLATAAGSYVLSALGLPQNLLRDLGLGLLGLIGVGLLVPRLAHLLEAPFTRLAGRATASKGGFVLGLGLGLVYVPCAGPVLAAISVLGATHRVSVFSVLLSLVFALGAAVPLLAVALVGDALVTRSRALSSRAPLLRRVAGAVLIVMSVVLATGALDGLERWTPGYTTALVHRIEGNTSITKQLRHLTNTGPISSSLASCENAAAASAMAGLANCGPAPQFTQVTAWLNTAGQSINLADLKGHVVLVDFYTYSCINCQRALPHVEAWYARYHSVGLDVIGIEAPEFAFEHVVSNIASASNALGIRYPIAVDDQLATWSAYHNDYWPADYLIDATGHIRFISYGEGAYSTTEGYIRQLLTSAHPHVALPPATNVPDRTPQVATSPETYLGLDRSQYLSGASLISGAHTYQFPTTTPAGYYTLAGSWRAGPEAITALGHARLRLNFLAHDVYLVLGGHGTVHLSFNGHALAPVMVSGYPTLYTLFSSHALTSGTLTLSASPGVSAYDFTFG